MIDWPGAAIASIWILGLSVLLAVLSYAYWLQGATRRFSQVLSMPFIQFSLGIGLLLFALGLLFSVGQWWERIGWAGVMVMAGWQGVRAWKNRHGKPGAS